MFLPASLTNPCSHTPKVSADTILLICENCLRFYAKYSGIRLSQQCFKSCNSINSTSYKECNVISEISQSHSQGDQLTLVLHKEVYLYSFEITYTDYHTCNYCYLLDNHELWKYLNSNYIVAKISRQGNWNDEKNTPKAASPNAASEHKQLTSFRNNDHCSAAYLCIYKHWGMSPRTGGMGWKCTNNECTSHREHHRYFIQINHSLLAKE